MTDLGNGRENTTRLMKRKTDRLEVGRGSEKISRMQYLQKADTVSNHKKAGEGKAALVYTPKSNTNQDSDP